MRRELAMETITRGGKAAVGSGGGKNKIAEP